MLDIIIKVSAMLTDQFPNSEREKVIKTGLLALKDFSLFMVLHLLMLAQTGQGVEMLSS